MSEGESNELASRPDASEAMSSGRADYACYCHAKVPALAAEVCRLRLLVAGIESAAKLPDAPHALRMIQNLLGRKE